MIDTKEYAKALFLLTEEDGITDAALSDVETVKTLLSENPAYRNLLDTPALSKEERLGLIDEAFTSLSAHVKNLLKILCEKHAIFSFTKIAVDYSALVDEARGIERVEAVSAVKMSDGQLSALKEKLESITGKTVIIRNTVDTSIIGGMKLRYAGLQLDGSLKSRLDSFEKALGNVVI